MTVRFTEPHMDYLEEQAERLGITKSDVVRRIIDTHLWMKEGEIHEGLLDNVRRQLYAKYGLS